MSSPPPPQQATDSTLLLTAQFGTWSHDIVAQDVEARKTKTISLSTHSALTLFDGEYVAKSWRSASDLSRELPVITLAGDCTVPILGRKFLHGKVRGIIMPYETTLEPSVIPTKDGRIRIIHQLCDLVRCLHDKNIIHGDIKPDNLILCSDGQLRFCDFGCASVEGDGFAPNAYTTHYASPWRVRNNDKPLSKAEDLYGTGVSLWQIYTGTIPFPETEDESDVDDFVKAGMRPDIGCIDDPNIANLVSLYLNSGPPLQDTLVQTSIVCVETEICLRFCSCDPPHTYTRVSRCGECIRKGSIAACPRRFVTACVLDTTNSPVCTTYNPGVIHRGL